MLKHILDNSIPVIEMEDKDGYWEIFKDHQGNIVKKIWHEEKKQDMFSEEDLINEELEEISMLKFKSKEQLDTERPQYVLLPHEDYELVISDIKYDKRKKYQSQDEENTITFTFDIVGLRDGGKAIDVDGNEAKDRKIFFTGSQNIETEEWRMGFMKDGTPSKLRQLVAYATKQNVEEEIELEAWENLLGKTIYAEIVSYTNQKGQKSNKISRFLLPPTKKNV